MKKELTLREKQSLFAKNMATLILWAFDNGMELTVGEWQRTEDQQTLYFEGLRLQRMGGKIKLFNSVQKSKTMFSDHLKKLAADVFLFINGDYKTDKESYGPLHKYWKTLHPNNYSGSDWGWDFVHFGMKEE